MNMNTKKNIKQLDLSPVVPTHNEAENCGKTLVMSSPVSPSLPPYSPAEHKKETKTDGTKKDIHPAEAVKNFLTDTFQIFHTHDVDLAVQTHNADTSSISITSEKQLTLVEDDINGKFSVQTPFAAGGQGTLSKGDDLNLQRLVAIKSLRKDLLKDAKQRRDFVAEARVTAQLDHPSIVPIYSLHTDKDDGLHLAMKLINGQDLKTYLQQITKRYVKDGIRRYDEKKSLKTRLDIFLKVCDALEYAHSRNIMHCDLKPENIMIGEYHDAYLMDWGIARLIKEPGFDPAKWVKPSHITGTPRFLSPESISGEYCDERADIYAMGLILYEITTLAEAYTAQSPKEILAKVLSEDIRPLTHRFHYHIDSDLKAIIRKASAWERDKRYQSIHDMSSDIRRYLRNEEVSAHPDNFIRKGFRWCLNHAVAFLILLLIMLLTAIATGAYNLYTAVTLERKEFALHEAINDAFLHCTDVAYDFDKKLNSIEGSLKATASELEFMLYSPQQLTPEVPTFPHSNYLSPKTVPDSLKDYPAFGGKFDFAHIACRTMPGVDMQTVEARSNKVAMFHYRFQEMMVNSPFGSFVTKRNYDMEFERMLEHGVPLTLVYLGFQDGLHFCYPGKIYAKEYDPRKRSWYKDHLDPDAPQCIWSTPYINAARTGIVVTISSRIDDINNNMIGVLAADLDVNQLLQKLSAGLESDSSILERTFISADGAVILTTNPDLNSMAAQKFYSLTNNDNINIFKYPDPKLLTQIRYFKSGYLDLGKDGHNKQVYCVFAKCQSIGWYYLEKIDIGKRIARMQKTK